METQLHYSSTLRYVSVDPGDLRPKNPLLIALHGFGADMYDLTGLVSALQRDDVRFIFPEAPLPAFDGADVSARAWYERGGQESPQSVADALNALEKCVADVFAKYAHENCVLLGFSQGGAMALRYGLAHPELFAGVVAMSSSLRQVENLQHRLPENRSQPVFLSHGAVDEVVPVTWTHAVHDFLQSEGYRPQLHTYRMGHGISPELIKKLRVWLDKVISS